MAGSTAKLLHLLEVLESRPVVGGAELAERLGVDRRTVRRYVTALQDLGIPVEGDRGAGGGYRLRPRFRLPPLMLDDGEAAVVALGLAAARRLGLGDPHDADAALAKLHRVLPPRLAGRIEALGDILGFTTAAVADAAAVPGERLLVLADAVRRRRVLHLEYRTFSGEQRRRVLSPHGLVVHAGRWYLAAFDHDRGDLRTFRVDRASHPDVQTEAALAPPDGFDAAAYVTRSLAHVPWRWEVDVVLDVPIETARRRVAATLAELRPEGDRTALLMRVESLDWMASVLAGLDCDFAIRAPEELRASVRALAARLEGRASIARDA